MPPETADALKRLTAHLGPFNPRPDETGRPEYRREPYVRVTLPQGAGTLDAKATAWTRTMVQIHWDDDGKVFNVWVPATAVTRIPRRESAWQDTYDDWAWYERGGQL